MSLQVVLKNWKISLEPYKFVQTDYSITMAVNSLLL